jgi:hypothetical protein
MRAGFRLARMLCSLDGKRGGGPSPSAYRRSRRTVEPRCIHRRADGTGLAGCQYWKARTCGTSRSDAAGPDPLAILGVLVRRLPRPAATPAGGWGLMTDPARPPGRGRTAGRGTWGWRRGAGCAAVRLAARRDLVGHGLELDLPLTHATRPPQGC